MNARLLASLFALMLTACPLQGGAKDSGDPIDTDSDTDTGSSDLQPIDGRWTFDFTVTENSCNEEMESSTSIMMLTSTGEGSFDIASPPKEGDDFVIHCTLDGSDFTCATYEDTISEGGLTITITMDMAGHFADPSHTEGTAHMHLTCQGRECEDASLPPECDLSQTFTATAQGN